MATKRRARSKTSQATDKLKELGHDKALAQLRIGYGLALYPLEAFPELHAPEAVREALDSF
jgi:hypothetical protein